MRMSCGQKSIKSIIQVDCFLCELIHAHALAYLKKKVGLVQRGTLMYVRCKTYPDIKAENLYIMVIGTQSLLKDLCHLSNVSLVNAYRIFQVLNDCGMPHEGKSMCIEIEVLLISSDILNRYRPILEFQITPRDRFLFL